MSIKTHYGVYSNGGAFCILKQNGSVICYGQDQYGGEFSHLINDLSRNVVKIIPSIHAFTALRSDGKVFTWGNSNKASYDIKEENSNYIDVYSNNDNLNMFLGIKNDGSAHVWGNGSVNTFDISGELLTGKISQVCSLTGAFILLKRNGTLLATSTYTSTAWDSFIKLNSSHFTNIKKIYTTNNGLGILKYDGSFSVTQSNTYEYEKNLTYGIRGRDGKLGDISVLKSGIKDVFTTKDYFFVHKTDGSLHIIGRLVYIDDNNEVVDNDFKLNQYAKVTSNVKDVYVFYNYNRCICVMNDNKCIPLHLDATSTINNDLVNVKDVYYDHIVKNDGSVVCLFPDTYVNFTTVQTNLSSGVIDIAVRPSSTCIAVKSNGSAIYWGSDPTNSQGPLSNNFGIKNHSGVRDNTLLDSNVVAVNYILGTTDFMIVHNDGKGYLFGMQMHGIYGDVGVGIQTFRGQLTDISNSSIQRVLPNYGRNGIHFHASDKCFPVSRNDIQITTLNQPKINSVIFNKPGITDSFTTFTPNLSNGNIYLYNDKAGKGILKDSTNTNIAFTLNNGLSSSAIQSILNHNLSQNSTFTFSASHYNNTHTTNSFDDKKETRKRRQQMVRTLFQNNITVTNFTASKESLALNIDKANLKVQHTLNNVVLNYNLNSDTDITATKGFYILLEENSKVNIQSSSINLITVECTGTDSLDSQIYYITSSIGASGVNIRYTNSTTYVKGSYPAGPFKDEDQVFLQEMNILLSGGIIDYTNNSDTVKYKVFDFIDVSPTSTSKIPIFPGERSYLGIAKNNYLYSWGNMDHSTQWVNGSKDANNEWTSATTGRTTDISNVYIGYQDRYAVLLKNGTISSRYYGFPALNDANNVWYDNGVKKNDLSTLNDVVELYCLFDYMVHGGAPIGIAIALRQDGSIALWGNKDFHKSDNTTELSATNKEYYTLRSSFGKRLMDSTDANFSRIKKISIGLSGFVILREDGKIAVIDRYYNETNLSYMGKYANWNRRQSSTYQHNTMMIDLPFTLGDAKKTLGNFYLTATEYLGNVIDIGTHGNRTTTKGSWYALNDKGQFFVFNGSYPNINSTANYYPPHDICYGNSTLEDPTSSPYFKKTVKVYSKYGNNNCFGGWIIIFEDGTGLTSLSETNKDKNKYTYTDVFSKYSWNYDTNNQNVKLFQPTDPIQIVKYYGPYVLLSNGFLRNITYSDTSLTNSKYYNWNHHEYGIKGTKYGFDANEPEYGDISGVKQIYMHNTATFCVKTNGDLLVWGRDTTIAADSTNLTTEIKNKFTNVNKVVGNEFAIAVLKNDGSVFCWGNVSYGGSITNTVPVVSTGISNFTLNEGVLDIFSNYYTFTAVKSSGLVTWGHSSHVNPSDTLDALANIEWEGKTSGFNSRTHKNRYSSKLVSIYNEYNTLDYPYQSTSTNINTILQSLKSANVDSTEVDNFLYYPKNIDFDKFLISDTFYKNGDKNIIRELLIELLFNFNQNINNFITVNTFLNMESKIKIENMYLIRPNSGIIDLDFFNNKYFGFYVPMKDDDIAVFRSPDKKLIFKITRSGSNYALEKVGGTADISSNKTSPLTSKTNINDFVFGFQNGIFDGRDDFSQKFNCISTTGQAAAYLNSKGKVITWGRSSYGGFSHDEDIFTNYSNVTPSSTYDINLNQDNLLENVVDIISSDSGFVALKNNGNVVSWGSTYTKTFEKTTSGSITTTKIPMYYYLKEYVKSIYANFGNAYAALLFDGSVILWGDSRYGGDTRGISFPLVNIKKIYPLKYGFAFINENNEMTTCGHDDVNITHHQKGVYGSYYKTINNFVSAPRKLSNILEVYHNSYYNVAINSNGDAIVWGTRYQALNSNLKNILNTNVFVNAFSTFYSFALVDISGGVYAFGATNTYNGTSGQWNDVSADISKNITRIVSSKHDFQCLRNDNTLIGIIGSGDLYRGVDYSNNDIRTSGSQQINLPPNEYIIGRYKLQNIKDIFPSEYGFAAIDTSDNVICWGHKSTSYITDIDYTKIRGGDLSGNDVSGNRPIAIFTNGKTWCCLKEDETVVTWEGTNTNLVSQGSDYNDSTYGINSTRWGGNGNGGAIRGGDGSITTLKNVKNIIPYGSGTTCGYIAICEDGSNNQFTVGWGSQHNDSRWSQTTPNANGRGFRHVCEELNNHSKHVIGIKNNRVNYGYRASATENIHEYNFGDKKFTDVPTGFGLPVTTIEVINSDEVIDEIIKDLSGTDISTNFIEEAQKEENKLSTDVDENEKISNETAKAENDKVNKVLNLTVDAPNLTPVQLRKQRKDRTKLLFALNPSRNKFKIKRVTLGDRNRFKKTNVVVYRVNFGKVEVNLKEDPNIDDTTGFYIPLEAGGEATMTNFQGTGKFKITISDDAFTDISSNKYFVEVIEGDTSAITMYRSNTYIMNSNPMGPFAEGDRIQIQGVNLELGSVTDGSPNYSFGDPYINPICGYPTKLPDQNAIYRMLEGFGVYLNASVHKLSEKKQKYMSDWFKCKSGFDANNLGLITNGYYYNKFYISSNKNTLLCDLDKNVC